MYHFPELVVLLLVPVAPVLPWVFVFVGSSKRPLVTSSSDLLVASTYTLPCPGTIRYPVEGLEDWLLALLPLLEDILFVKVEVVLRKL